jgi:hypothetical protein
VRLGPATHTPTRVGKLLLPYELNVITVHLHPARIIPSLVTALGGLIAAIAVGPLARGDITLELIIWLFVVILLGQLARAVVDWQVGYVVITSQRLFKCGGLINSDVTLSVPLETIRDIRLTRSFAGRIYGYGTLVLPSQHLTIDYVPYPEQMYLEILGLVYPNPSPDSESSF